MKTLKLVVVGVGHIGRLHARKIRDFAARGEAVELLGVVDLDASALARVAEELACPAFQVSVGAGDGSGADAGTANGAGSRGATASGAAAECFARADAAVVAVPTALHAQSAAPLLLQGLDLLVEKPIAASCEEAEYLLETARARGRMLQVGHVEWFNPALRRARPYLARPHKIEARRHNPVPARGVHDDVVCDLMIHDIDIVQRVLGETPKRIESRGRIGGEGLVDHADALLCFPSGAEARLSARRTTGESMRTMTFHQQGARLVVDFLKQEARLHEAGAGAPQRLAAEPGPAEQAGDDPLEAQLRAFLDALRGRSVQAGAGEQARDALRTALRVLDGIQERSG